MLCFEWYIINTFKRAKNYNYFKYEWRNTMHISKNAAMQIVDEISQLVKQNINLRWRRGI